MNCIVREYELLIYLNIPDLVAIVEEYVHRPGDLRVLFPKETKIGGVSIIASEFTLQFVIRAEQVGNSPGEHSTIGINESNPEFNAYELLAPENWALISMQLWPDEHERELLSAQFKPVVKQLQWHLRTNYEQDMHWLVNWQELLLNVFARTLNHLYSMSGSVGLKYTV